MESVLCTVHKSSVIPENPYASVGATEGPHVHNNIEELQIFYGSLWAISSVGWERILDVDEVIGSNPILPTMR